MQYAAISKEAIFQMLKKLSMISTSQKTILKIKNFWKKFLHSVESHSYIKFQHPQIIQYLLNIAFSNQLHINRYRVINKSTFQPKNVFK